MELSDLVATIRRYWLLVVLLPVLAVVPAWLTRPTPKYSSSVTVQVLPAGGYQDLSAQAVQILVPAVVQRLDSQDFDDNARGTVPAVFAGDPVTVATTGDTTSGLVTIEATSDDQDAVAPWANAYATALLSEPGSVQGFGILRKVNSAVIPGEPNSNNEKAVLAGAALLGLLIGILAVLALDAVRVQNADPARRNRRFNARVVADVARTRRRRGAAPSLLPPLLTASSALHALGIEIEIARRQRPFNTLAVLPERRGDGASSLLSALAWAMGQSGLSVAVLDADPVRPTQAANLGVEKPQFGVEQNVDGNAGVTYLGVPRMASEPTHMVIASVAAVVDQLSQRGDLTLIDGPPCADGPEAEAIAVVAGTVLLVVSGRRVNGATVRRRLNQLRSRDVTVLGLVINHPPRRRRRRAAGGRQPSGSGTARPGSSGGRTVPGSSDQPTTNGHDPAPVSNPISSY